MLDHLSGSNGFLTTKELLFHQTLDHFAPCDHRRFEQRYYEYLGYFRSPDGPIFLKICGEASCNGIFNGYTSGLAKKFGAALITLEHRYYGKIVPFKSLTTENLRYLSSKQALFDLAVFRQHYQIGESVGAECKAALQETTRLVEERLASNKQGVKQLFDADELEIDGDFLNFLADATVIAVQYGYQDTVCLPLVQAKKDGKDLVDAYAKYVKDDFVGSWGIRIRSYNQKYLKNTSLTQNSSVRLWWFQVCTEVAYFQVAPAKDSIRSSKVDTRYHLDLCKNVFGEGIYPDVDATNTYYGGTKIAGSKIVFTYGSQDPWRRASKQISTPDMPSYLISCHICAHGIDIVGCPHASSCLEGDAQNFGCPEAVDKARQQIIEHMDLGLSQCRASGRRFI